MRISENTSKRVQDMYSRNPIEILSKQEFKNLKDEQKKDVEIKAKRVLKLFGSNQIKNTVQTNKESNMVQNQKITNNSYGILMNAGKEYEPTGKKTFKHIVEKNRVFYY